MNYVLRWKWYCNTRLYKEWKRNNNATHRLIAKTFIPNPDNLPQVNHKNWIKTDNRVENLEWCTVEYNIIDTFKRWINKSAKISYEWLKEILQLRGLWYSQKYIWDKLWIHQTTVSLHLNNKRKIYA